MNKKVYEVFEGIILSRLRPVGGVFGFQRNLKKAIQGRWKYRKESRELDQIFMCQLRGENKPDPEEKNEKKSIYISERDGY